MTNPDRPDTLLTTTMDRLAPREIWAYPCDPSGGADGLWLASDPTCPECDRYLLATPELLALIEAATTFQAALDEFDAQGTALGPYAVAWIALNAAVLAFANTTKEETP